MEAVDQTLRDFGTLGLQKQMVEDLVNTRSSKKLQYIFSDSVSHFSRRYKDTRAFRGGQSASLQGYRDATEQFARCVAARLECGAVQVIPGPSLPTVPHRQLEFVDYEISPFRTPGGAEFEDGTSGRGSGAGGVDLILVDDAGALVISEIKAPRDSTTFLAFVQALTYAAELTTRSQAERLRRWYPKLANLTLGEDGCQCDMVPDLQGRGCSTASRPDEGARKLISSAGYGNRTKGPPSGLREGISLRGRRPSPGVC